MINLQLLGINTKYGWIDGWKSESEYQIGPHSTFSLKIPGFLDEIHYFSWLFQQGSVTFPEFSTVSRQDSPFSRTSWGISARIFYFTWFSQVFLPSFSMTFPVFLPWSRSFPFSSARIPHFIWPLQVFLSGFPTFPAGIPYFSWLFQGFLPGSPTVPAFCLHLKGLQSWFPIFPNLLRVFCQDFQFFPDFSRFSCHDPVLSHFFQPGFPILPDLSKFSCLDSLLFRPTCQHGMVSKMNYISPTNQQHKKNDAKLIKRLLNRLQWGDFQVSSSRRSSDIFLQPQTESKHSAIIFIVK